MKILTKYLPEIPNQVMAKDAKGGFYWFAPGQMVDTEEEAKEIERLAGRDVIYNVVNKRAVDIAQAIEKNGGDPDALINDILTLIAPKENADGNAS